MQRVGALFDIQHAAFVAFAGQVGNSGALHVAAEFLRRKPAAQDFPRLIGAKLLVMVAMVVEQALNLVQ